MMKSVKLNQDYRDTFSLAIIGGFLLLSVIKMASLLSSGAIYTMESLALLSTITILTGLIFLARKVRLKIKISKKKVSIKVAPFGIARIKFRRHKIQDVSFFATDAITKSSGLFVNFGNNGRVINFGSNKGMTIELKDGRKYTFFSKHLYDQQDQITNLLTQ